jgi:hypothetical protein
MNKRIFRKIKEGDDVSDIIAMFFALIAIPASLFVIIFTLWILFAMPGNA